MHAVGSQLRPQRAARASEAAHPAPTSRGTLTEAISLAWSIQIVRGSFTFVLAASTQIGKYIPVEIDVFAEKKAPQTKKVEGVRIRPSALEQATQVCQPPCSPPIWWWPCRCPSAQIHVSMPRLERVPLLVQDFITLILSDEMFTNAMAEFEVPPPPGLCCGMFSSRLYLLRLASLLVYPYSDCCRIFVFLAWSIGMLQSRISNGRAPFLALLSKLEYLTHILPW